jgi:hypothetical protein
MKKKRNTGDILLEAEPLIQELLAQGLQWSDLIGLLYVYLMVHAPEAREEYTDGTHPELYYGPRK